MSLQVRRKRQLESLNLLRRLRREEQARKQRIAEQARERRTRERAEGVIFVDDVKQMLAKLRKEATSAVSRATARERRLYSFGEPLHDEGTHKRLLSGIKSERNAVLSRVGREARAIAEEQRRTLELALDFPRDSILGPVSRSEVNSRLPYIQAELAGMNEGQLRSRLEFVTRHGSLSERYTHWMVANARRYEILQKRREARGPEHGPAPDMTSFDRELDALDRLLFEAEYEKRTQHVQQALSAATELETLAYQRARDAESMAGAYLSESRRHVREFAEAQKYARGGQPLQTPAGPSPEPGTVANG